MFDPAIYQIFISNRSRTQRTGFAVRKSIAVVRNSDFSALIYPEDGTLESNLSDHYPTTTQLLW